MTTPWRSFWWLLRRSFRLAYEDGCFGTAKGAAYSALLCFFPLLTATATLLVQARAESISGVLYRALSRVVPPGTEDLVLENFRVRGARPAALLVVATLVSLWAASRVMTSLMEGFQAAYHIPKGRPFLRHQGMAILLVLATAVPVAAASALVLFGNRTEQAVMRSLGVIPAGQEIETWVKLVASAARYLVAIAAYVAVTATLYRLGPNRVQRWRLLWPGAFVSTVLWLISTMGFAWYVRNIAGYNLLYGSIGAAIALLVWMYVMAAVILIGCEFNAEYERLKGTGTRG
ncbi:MAG TPA: YihY/virulence factor BrkB family protein [Bryobacteraceae bacterium]|nr:YihY/virulence factor BrkB family protein [Bryobacteraceae bacterium]